MRDADFSSFTNCQLSTEEIIENLPVIKKEETEIFLKFLYSLLYHSNTIQIRDIKDLHTVMMAYHSYHHGHFVTVDAKIF